MLPAQIKPYQAIDCFLASYFLLFFVDTLWLIYAYPGTASLFQDKSIYFFFMEFQYFITLVESTLLGTGLALFSLVISRFSPLRTVNICLNALFIVVIIFLSRKALKFTTLVPNISLSKTVTFIVCAGLAIVVLICASTAFRNILKNVLSKNAVKGGRHLGFLAFFVLIAFSSVFILKPIVAGDLKDKPEVDGSLKMSGFQNYPKKDLPDILFIVYDQLSASHTGFENYPRHTTPNLERFAESAYYFKNHFSNYNQTSPSFASLLTGKSVLHHRVFQHGGLIPREQRCENIFPVTNKLGYKNIVYTHVLTSEVIFRQCQESFHLIKPSHELRVYSEHFWENFIDTPFLRFGKELAKFKPISSFLDTMYLHVTMKNSKVQDQYTGPTMYVNEVVHEWLYEVIRKEESPRFIFVHLFPPHLPYFYRKVFGDKFSSVSAPLLQHPTKPASEFASVPHGNSNHTESSRDQLDYDRLLFDTDQKFGNFVDALKKTDFFDKAMIIFTSDHGLQFGNGHSGPGNMLYNEMIKVPLIIKFPGQKKGRVFERSTSSIDIAPSLLSYLNQEVPDWMDGEILPGFPGTSGTEEPRALFSYAAQRNKPYEKISNIMVSLIKYPYKLIYYTFPDEFELYNIQADFYETSDISESYPENARSMQREVKRHIEYFDSKYFDGE